MSPAISATQRANERAGAYTPIRPLHYGFTSAASQHSGWAAGQ